MDSGAGGTVGLLVAGAIGIAVIIILAAQYEKRQREKRLTELGALAQQLGLRFFPEGLGNDAPSGLFALFFGGQEGPASRLLGLLQGFEPFGRGHSQRIPGLLAGEWNGVDWILLDYEYKITTSSGKSTSTTTYRPSIVVARLPLFLPEMTLSGESFLSRFGEMFGLRDIQFESEEFNRQYRVKCSDSKAAFDLIHPGTIEFLLERSPHDWQMGGPFILLWSHRWATPGEYLWMMEEIRGFVELVPDYFREDRGISRPPGGALDGVLEESGGA